MDDRSRRDAGWAKRLADEHPFLADRRADGVTSTLVPQKHPKITKQSMTVMIDVTHLQAHRTATSLQAKSGGWRPEGPSDLPTQGWPEHQTACCNRCPWPSDPGLDDGRSAHRSYASGRASGQPADGLLADGAYDADGFRQALKHKGIKRQTPRPDADRVRAIERLATGRDPLRCPQVVRCAAVTAAPHHARRRSPVGWVMHPPPHMPHAMSQAGQNRRAKRC